MAQRYTYGVRISGDSRDAVQAVQLTERELKQLDSQMRRTARGGRDLDREFQGWASSTLSFRDALGPLVGVAGVGMVAQLGRDAIATTSELGKASDTAGITAESLQELRFAFGELAGVTDKQVDVSLQRFNRRLGLAAEGSGAAADTFDELGVSIRGAGGSLRESEPVLDAVLTAIAKIENDARRAAQASEIFGEEAGPRLAAALKNGIGGLNAAREAARDLGLVIDNETVDAAERLDDKFGRIAKTLDTTFKEAVVGTASVLEDLAGDMDRFFSSLSGGVEALAQSDQIALIEDRIKQVGDALARERKDLAAGITSSEEDIVELTRKLRDLNTQLDILTGARTRRPGANVGDEAKKVVDGAIAGFTPDLAPIPSFEPALPSIGELTESGRQLDMERQAAFDMQWLDQAKQAREYAQSLDQAGLMADRVGGEIIDLGDVGSENLAELEREAQRVQEGLNAMTDKASTATDVFEEFGLQAARGLQDAFADFLFKPFDEGLDGMVKDFANMLQRLAAEIAAQKLLSMLFETGSSGAAGGWAGVVQGVLGDLFGSSGRAAGGAVNARTPYLVGERGPEMFMPAMNGSIIPNHQLAASPSAAGGGGVVVNQTINVRDAESFRRSRTQIAADVERGVRGRR